MMKNCKLNAEKSVAKIKKLTEAHNKKKNEKKKEDSDVDMDSDDGNKFFEDLSDGDKKVPTVSKGADGKKIYTSKNSQSKIKLTNKRI